MRKIWTKKVTILSFLAVMSLFAVMTNAVTAGAKVQVKLKKGICYVTGKGAMKKKQILSEKKKAKVKKLVLGKGVTSIPTCSFANCKKLKKVKISKTVKSIGAASFFGTKIRTLTIPNSVKSIGENVFDYCEQLSTVKMPGKFKVLPYDNEVDSSGRLNSYSAPIQKVIFTTDFDEETAKMICCENLIVKKKDSKYVSVDGVVYSKDKKTIIRVPSLKKELKIMDGCETFPLIAIDYALWDSEECEIHGGLLQLEKLVLPESIKKIINVPYKYSHETQFQWTLRTIDIRTKQLPPVDVKILYDFFVNKEVIGKGLEDSGYFQMNGSNMIIEGTKLLYYLGNEDTVIIPDEVTEIGEGAFYNTLTSHVIFGKNVKKVGREAFYGAELLESVTLNEGLETIGDRAFDCTALNKIVYPSTLK